MVRLHRAGEGAPYTGLRPAGLDVGPVLPLAERAVRTGTPDPVAEFLSGVLRDELGRRLEMVNALAAVKDRSLPEGRRYVEAMLGFEVYSHHLLQAMRLLRTATPETNTATHRRTVEKITDGPISGKPSSGRPRVSHGIGGPVRGCP